MDNALYSSAAGRAPVVPEPDHHSPAAALRIAGACIECGHRTESLVTFEGKAAFLCPPCGQAIRLAVAA